MHACMVYIHPQTCFACHSAPQEAYCNMLVKFHEEMARPIQEATEFFNSMERQLGSTISGNYFISICSVSDR